MGVLRTTAENSGLLKKKKDKSTAVKLKASDYVGLPNNTNNNLLIFKVPSCIGAVLS